MILVGGQALAFWAAYYHTPAPTIAITKDVDLLGTRADVERLARGLDARAVFPQRRTLPCWWGRFSRTCPMAAISASTCFSASTEISLPRLSPVARFWPKIRRAVSRVMHPLDVLQGRLENVHGLAAKQDEHGLAQLRLAIDMSRNFVADIASQEASGVDGSGRPVVLRHFTRIESWRCPTPAERERSGMVCTLPTQLTRRSWGISSRS